MIQSINKEFWEELTFNRILENEIDIKNQLIKKDIVPFSIYELDIMSKLENKSTIIYIIVIRISDFYDKYQ